MWVTTVWRWEHVYGCCTLHSHNILCTTYTFYGQVSGRHVTPSVPQRKAFAHPPRPPSPPGLVSKHTLLPRSPSSLCPPDPRPTFLKDAMATNNDNQPRDGNNLGLA